jgi:hypothetical protein
MFQNLITSYLAFIKPRFPDYKFHVSAMDSDWDRIVLTIAINNFYTSRKLEFSLLDTDQGYFFEFMNEHVAYMMTIINSPVTRYQMELEELLWMCT